MTYAQKLRDPRWQKKRLEVLKSADFTCQGCGSKERTLHVHHTRYFKDRDPWDYRDGELRCFCESCHGHYDEMVKDFSFHLCWLLVDEANDLYLALTAAMEPNSTCFHVLRRATGIAAAERVRRKLAQRNTGTIIDTGSIDDAILAEEQE